MPHSRKEPHFPTAVIIILIIIALFVAAFFTESKKTTGLVVYDEESLWKIGMSDLAQLSTGNYYIDDNGIIYWLDDSSKPAIAKVHPIRQVYTDRYLYVSDEGTVFYNG